MILRGLVGLGTAAESEAWEFSSSLELSELGSELEVETSLLSASSSSSSADFLGWGGLEVVDVGVKAGKMGMVRSRKGWDAFSFSSFAFLVRVTLSAPAVASCARFFGVVEPILCVNLEICWCELDVSASQLFGKCTEV